MTTLSAINALDEDAFVRLLGSVFEHSPWVARRAFAGRPFASRAALHAAMVAVVKHASPEEQLALLNAHPQLAGEETRAGRLSASSRAEQSSAGLDALAPAQHDRVAQLNRDYRTKFGFPFIIAVRDHDRHGILAQLERRLREDRETEIANGLGQVYRIAAIRLESMVDTR
jgi:2-oxo-4-hydroxy-4-carboxy-5-ureidoimidazoline decarboxylase